MRVSVFITSYNQKGYLAEAIESVLAQTFSPFEIIIVDDCSTDGSQDLIQDYARRYPGLIRPFCHEKNMGIPKNKSFAMNQVRGDFVTYLDGDDRFLPEKLEREIETCRTDPEAKVVFSNFYFIDESGQRQGVWHEAGANPPPTGYVFREVFGRQFPTGNLFRNELVDYPSLKSVGFYDKDLAMYHDWELRVRLTKKYSVAYCPVPLSEYRMHPGGISRRGAAEHLREFLKVYKKNQGLIRGLPKADREFIKAGLLPFFSRFSLWAAMDSARAAEFLRMPGLFLRYAGFKLLRLI